MEKFACACGSTTSPTRAGERGNTSNISVTASNEKGWQVIHRELTPDRVLAHFRHLIPGPVPAFNPVRNPGLLTSPSTALGSLAQQAPAPG